MARARCYENVKALMIDGPDTLIDPLLEFLYQVLLVGFEHMTIRFQDTFATC